MIDLVLVKAEAELRKRFPQIEKVWDVIDQDIAVAYRMERDGKAFVLAAVEGTIGDKVGCPLAAYTEAAKHNIQLIVAIGTRFYKFELWQIYNAHKFGVWEKHQTIMFDVRLGVNIEKSGATNQLSLSTP